MAHSSQTVAKRGHPGRGKNKSRRTPKGRQIDLEALAQVREILGGRSRQRDLLIEHLHLIQDHYNCLSAAHLTALAEEMKLTQAEVFEVASFYAHFDVVKEGDSVPSALTIRVCESISCELAGSKELFETLAETVGENVRVLRGPCMGRCESAPIVEVGHNHMLNASIEGVKLAVKNDDTHSAASEYKSYEDYTEQDGYRFLKACLEGVHSPDSVIDTMEKAGLRGLGGAGFPTGMKWKIVRGYSASKMMAVNADEGEPGTFKDRYYLETDPHRFLEGMLIAAWVIDAAHIYIYLRDEYPAILQLLQVELEQLEKAGLLVGRKVEIRRGAGAYICGEESAMLESIEGKRGIPRNRPPYVAEVGLFGQPTLVNNVESLYQVRDIVERGPEWFSEAGANGQSGWRSYSVSGRVKRPGVKFTHAGVTARELIEDYCGGMQDGHSFKAYLPGGASGGILPESLGDEPLDFGTIEQHGGFIGSAAVVVFSDQDNMRDVALNLMRFFEDESCGQCTPCRVGTEKTVKLMEMPNLDKGLLSQTSRVMSDASICGLGQAAGNPVNSLLKYFPEDLS